MECDGGSPDQYGSGAVRISGRTTVRPDGDLIFISSRERMQTKTTSYIQATRYIRLGIILFLVMIFVVVGNYWLRGELGKVGNLLKSTKDQLGGEVLIVGGIVYLLLLSRPFVPGVELGLLLMCLFGREGIVFVYLATVGGLLLAFTVGRCVPKPCILCWLRKLGMIAIAQDPPDWMEATLKHSKLGQKLPHRFSSSLIRYRYLMLAILFNLPGNSLLGGGGGIALICGMSRVFQWKWFVLTVVLVTAPVPLLAYLGFIQLEALLQ